MGRPRGLDRPGFDPGGRKRSYPGKCGRKKSDDLVIRRLLGVQRGYAALIGLDDAWAARIIESAGNYREIHERELRAGSDRRLPCGPNNSGPAAA